MLFLSWVVLPARTFGKDEANPGKSQGRPSRFILNRCYSQPLEPEGEVGFGNVVRILREWCASDGVMVLALRFSRLLVLNLHRSLSPAESTTGDRMKYPECGEHMDSVAARATGQTNLQTRQDLVCLVITADSQPTSNADEALGTLSYVKPKMLALQ